MMWRHETPISATPTTRRKDPRFAGRARRLGGRAKRLRFTLCGGLQSKRRQQRIRRQHLEGRVRLADSGRVPTSRVTVQAGQSVTWTWEDQGNQHSVTADDGSFESCLQSAGSSFTTTFTKAGAYPYHCTIHAQMKGTVTVS